MDLAIKVYDINYEFILKNYLDRSLWKKTWTVFIFKDIKFDMQLRTIDTNDNSVGMSFSISQGTLKETDYIWVYLDNFNMKVFDKQVKGVLFRLLEKLEDIHINRTQEMVQLRQLEREHNDTLREIAIDFLDSEGVKNDTIREAYIDSYVNNDTLFCGKENDLLRDMRFTIFTEAFITLTKVMGDISRYDTIVSKIGVSKATSIIKEMEEELQQEAYRSDLERNLESL